MKLASWPTLDENVFVFGLLSPLFWYHVPLKENRMQGTIVANACILKTLSGADEAGIIRSLPLPNLSAVTRQAAKEYFDNSWTLYETLFAGLKGEEGFYRYVDMMLLLFNPTCSFQ